MKKFYILVIFVFILALAARFIYFPNNVYLSYDQARDFFFAQNILRGDLRLIGPPSAASDKLFPGPLSLYIYALIQAFFGKNPEVMSVFFRLYNALGVFLVYLIAKKLFNKKIGLLAAGLYAFSYEQSQYSLLMSHQPLAVLPVLLLYLGLTLFLFDKENRGLIFAFLGLGLAIQMHYVYIILIPIVFGLFVVLRRNIHKLKFRYIVTAIFAFLLSVSTYVVSELKFNFRMASAIFGGTKNSSIHVDGALFAINRFIHDTFSADYRYTSIVLIIILIVFLFYLFQPKMRDKTLFLLFWFIGGVLPYLLTGTPTYYYSAAATVSLLIFFSFLTVKIFRKNSLIGFALLSIVILNNFFQILNQNQKGPNSDMVIQPGMLVSQEKKALDYVYQEAGGKQFVVRALTIPLNVNTTWSYLFEWYGKEKYGYLPVWGGKPAEGFPGNLSYSVVRSGLPETQFVIVEPTLGIRESDIEKFFTEESYFSKTEEEKKFGTIIVQKRKKI